MHVPCGTQRHAMTARAKEILFSGPQLYKMTIDVQILLPTNSAKLLNISPHTKHAKMLLCETSGNFQKTVENRSGFFLTLYVD